MTIIYRQVQCMERENPNKWEEESITSQYIMESAQFGYEEVKKDDNFGIKKY